MTKPAEAKSAPAAGLLELLTAPLAAPPPAELRAMPFPELVALHKQIVAHLSAIRAAHSEVGRVIHQREREQRMHRLVGQLSPDEKKALKVALGMMGMG